MSSQLVWTMSIVAVVAALAATVFLRTRFGMDTPRGLARQVGSFAVLFVFAGISGFLLIPLLGISGGEKAAVYAASAAWGSVCGQLFFGRRHPVS